MHCFYRSGIAGSFCSFGVGCRYRLLVRCGSWRASTWRDRGWTRRWTFVHRTRLPWGCSYSWKDQAESRCVLCCVGRCGARQGGLPGKKIPNISELSHRVGGKMVPGKMVPGKNGPQKNGPRKNGPRKNGPREKWSPEKWSPGNSETKNRGVSVEHRCVCVERSDVINLWKPIITHYHYYSTTILKYFIATLQF